MIQELPLTCGDEIPSNKVIEAYTRLAKTLSKIVCKEEQEVHNVVLHCMNVNSSLRGKISREYRENDQHKISELIRKQYTESFVRNRILDSISFISPQIAISTLGISIVSFIFSNPLFGFGLIVCGAMFGYVPVVKYFQKKEEAEDIEFGYTNIEYAINIDPSIRRFLYPQLESNIIPIVTKENEYTRIQVGNNYAYFMSRNGKIILTDKNLNPNGLNATYEKYRENETVEEYLGIPFNIDKQSHIITDHGDYITSLAGDKKVYFFNNGETIIFTQDNSKLLSNIKNEGISDEQYSKILENIKKSGIFEINGKDLKYIVEHPVFKETITSLKNNLEAENTKHHNKHPEDQNQIGIQSISVTSIAKDENGKVISAMVAITVKG